jgi:hypothetical protein
MLRQRHVNVFYDEAAFMQLPSSDVPFLHMCAALHASKFVLLIASPEHTDPTLETVSQCELQFVAKTSLDRAIPVALGPIDSAAWLNAKLGGRCKTPTLSVALAASTSELSSRGYDVNSVILVLNHVLKQLGRDELNARELEPRIVKCPVNFPLQRDSDEASVEEVGGMAAQWLFCDVAC